MAYRFIAFLVKAANRYSSAEPRVHLPAWVQTFALRISSCAKALNFSHFPYPTFLYKNMTRGYGLMIHTGSDKWFFIRL
jgi:hypothetical protein